MSALAASPTISPSQSALSAAAYLRIASLSIAAYDYIITLHAEYRMYKSSDRRKLGLVLFILIRYISVVTMVVSNVGFFSHSFTASICKHYFRTYPVFKSIQLMVSHIIMGLRTWNIAQRNIWVGRTVSWAFIAAMVVEWISAMAHRIPQMTNGNCMIGSTHPTAFLSTWSFYLAATLYDCLTISISTYYLLKLRRAEASAASGLVKILLYDGLMYFVAVAIVNIINIILYRGTDHAIQSSGASLAYAITWIMSQRIILHTREAGADQTPVVLTQMPNSSATPRSLRFFKESKRMGELSGERTLGPSRDDTVVTPSDFDLHVRIERSVVTDTKLESGESLEGQIYAPADSEESGWGRGFTI